MNPTPEMINRFEKAVRANGYRTGDDATEREYQAAKADLTAALALLPAEPAAVMWVDSTGCEHVTTDVDRGKAAASAWGYAIRPLYAAPPSAVQEPVTVKAQINSSRLPYDLRLQIGKALDRLVCDNSTPEQVDTFITTFANFGLSIGPLDRMEDVKTELPIGSEYDRDVDTANRQRNQRDAYGSQKSSLEGGIPHRCDKSRGSHGGDLLGGAEGIPSEACYSRLIPLIWELDTEGQSFADVFYGRYRAQRNPTDRWCWGLSFNGENGVGLYPVDNFEEAKAAAQADYEQRIRSALSTSQSDPAPEKQSIVAQLERMANIAEDRLVEIAALGAENERLRKIVSDIAKTGRLPPGRARSKWITIPSGLFSRARAAVAPQQEEAK